MNSLQPRSLLIAIALLLVPVMAAAQSTYQKSEEYVTPKKREIRFYGMRAYPFGRIPQNARQNAIEQAESRNSALGKRSRMLSAANVWQQHGPVNVGGRVRSVAVHPTDGRTLWIGAADGGVWKSTDAGTTWTSVMDGENSIAMGALAVAPSNPSILYAGTGEQSSNIDAYLGAGMMKSTDGGTTWKLIGLSTIGAFSRVVVHPTNPDIVIAGATKNGSGLYRSEDGGNSWQKAPEIGAVTDIAMNPQNPNELWIGTMAQGIYYSTDGGRSAVRRNSGLSISGSILRRVSVQVAPSSPNILYTLIDEERNGTEFSRIYKSTNSGTSWTNVFLGAGSNHILNGQGWYNNVLSIKPDDPNTVVVGGVSLVRTTNGGSSWNNASGAHPDQHAMAFDPTNPSVLYLGNDGGMYKSTNSGATFDDINKGLAITQFYAMGVDQNPPGRTYGGTQDNGTIHNQSQQYGDVVGADGGYTTVDHSNSNRIFGETQNGNLWRKDLSSNNLVQIMDGVDQTESSPWMAPFTMDPVESNVLYYGRSRIYKTVSSGDFWEPVSELFGHISAVAVSRADRNVVWAGTETGGVHVSTDGGQTWVDRSFSPGIVNRWVTDFAPSYTEPGTAYMSLSGFLASHILKTTDHGATWTDVSTGLPDIPVNALAIHHENPQVIFAGTDIGMFMSEDGGASWVTFNNGLPRVAVIDLEIHRASGMLRAATHGRSIWEIDLTARNIGPDILSPTGGEIWTGNTLQLISWHGFTAPVKVEYSLDNGVTWIEIASNVAGTSMRWNVKDSATMFARIRVTGSDNKEQVVSRTFTIEKIRLGSVIGATSKPMIPYALGYDGEFLWVADFGSSRMLKLDRNTLVTREVIETDLEDGDSLFTDLAYVPERGTMFVNKLMSTETLGGWLYEMSMTGQQIARWQSPAQYPIGLAWLGGPESNLQYMVLTDRNGDDQMIHLMDLSDPSAPLTSLPRVKKVPLGPRGASAAGPEGTHFWQVITDFTGNSLVSATAQKIRADETQEVECVIELSTSSSGMLNARGIEYDPVDKNLWISDYLGNIWKMVTCEGLKSVEIPLGVPATPAPTGIALEQNRPNPFAGQTQIRFTLEQASDLRLVVSDMQGRILATLHEGRMAAGTHSVPFNAAGLSSGVYRYSIVLSSGAVLSKTMVLVK